MTEHMAAVGRPTPETLGGYSTEQLEYVEKIAGWIEDFDTYLGVDAEIDWSRGTFTLTVKDAYGGPAADWQTTDLTELERYWDRLEDPAPQSTYDGPRAEND